MRTPAWIATISTFLILGCSPSEDQQHLDRMTAEHRDDSPVENPASAAQPIHEVDTQRVVYATHEGVEVEGLLATPRGLEAPAPGVIVIHEWWGLNENIESMTMQLAGEGYSALAIDLYSGNVATDRDQARSLMKTAMSNSSSLEENIRQAFRYLEESGAAHIGVIGWCFGGGWSLRTALLLPGELDAAVIYYGQVVTDRERLETIDTPLLGIFGSEDKGIPLTNVRAFESALNELGKEAAIHVYEGADHAFANPSGTRYQAAAAEDAWQQTLSFFDRHLRDEVADDGE